MIKPHLCRWDKRLFERFGGDYHLVNVVALGAIKGPVGQGMRFWHNASLKQAGARNTLGHR